MTAIVAIIPCASCPSSHSPLCAVTPAIPIAPHTIINLQITIMVRQTGTTPILIISCSYYKTLLEMQPKDSGDGGGGAMSMEEKVKNILDEIMEKLPDEFNLYELNQKVEEKTPYVVVALQECERMNILMNEIRTTLKACALGLKV